MNIPLLTLTGVFILIAVRQIGSVRLQIWQVMTGGALLVLFTGGIPLPEAIRAVNPDVMLFLFGMFVVGRALEESGYLAHVSYAWFRRARTRNQLLFMLLFGGGLGSALLMNDTLAIIGTPVVLLLARKHDMSPRVLLLALAFAITIGSVTSPIGNPQNLLIALRSGMPDPFVTFLRHLLLPTLINLGLTWFILRALHRDDFHHATLSHSQEQVHDRDLALLSRIALGVILLLTCAKIVLNLVGSAGDIRLTHIALAASLPVLVGSRKRFGILRRLDWQTLTFFASMFIMMESVWRTGFFQEILRGSGVTLAAPPTILLVSIGLSQAISNVPLVALYQPMLDRAGAGIPALMALAAGSTIAGNLFILGAASNVIIVQNAEQRGTASLSFGEFARTGIPVTAVNALVYWFFLTIF